AAMGDLRRCDTPRALMQFLGLLPSDSASGERRHQGSRTQAGNPQARRARVAGAWASRSPAKVSRQGQLRRENHPTMLQDISWHAQGRLGKRYRPRVARGPHAHIVTVAMARERAGCLWAMATQLPVAVDAAQDRLPLPPQR